MKDNRRSGGKPLKVRDPAPEPSNEPGPGVNWVGGVDDPWPEGPTPSGDHIKRFKKRRRKK